MGVMLMVGVVVILSGVVGLQVLSIGQTTTPVPAIAFDFEYTDNGSTDTLRIRHHAGETVDGTHVTVVVADATPADANGRYSWIGGSLDGAVSVASGSSVELNSTSIGDGSTLNLDDASVKIVWNVSDGAAAGVVSEWEESTDTTSGQSISQVDGTVGATDTKKVTFDVSAEETVTVEKFSVETARNLSSLSVVDANEELRITGAGQPGSADAPAGYPTDGTVYPLNTTKEIDSGADATVHLKRFNENLDIYGFTDAANADITITLVLADGSTKEFHVAADSA